MECVPFGEQGLSAHSWGALGYRLGFRLPLLPFLGSCKRPGVQAGLGEADGHSTWGF